MKAHLIVGIIGLVISTPIVGHAARGLQARFEKSLNDARTLTNVDIRMLEVSIYPNSPNEADFSCTYEYRYIVSGPRFRATRKLLKATQPNSKKLSEVAFDGASFLSYEADTRMVTRQQDIPGSDSAEHPWNPLIAPFLFLTKNSDDCPTCQLRFTDLVAPGFPEGFALPQTQESNGVFLIPLPGRPLAGKPTSWQITLEAAGDSFTPETIKLSIEAGGELTWKLLSYTNLGGYHLPTRIEETHSSYPPTSPPKVISTTTVTLLSVSVPDTVAASTFTLDKEVESAAVVWNKNLQRFEHSIYDEPKAKFLRSQPRIYDEAADGSKQVAEALALASKERKRVLLQFGANGCIGCHHLHKILTEQPTEDEIRKGYVVVRIDVGKEHNQEIDLKYGHPTRFGLPVMVILDADGKLLTTQNTEDLEGIDRQDPQDFLANSYSSAKVGAFLRKWTPNR